jgi:transcriptional regulator of NAD metabolism
MKKKTRIEIERKIVSRVKRELDQPRLTESVRNGFSVQDVPAVEKPAARSARA